MNTHGDYFRVTTWGESHGLSMGAVIDGCPAGLKLKEEQIVEALLRDVPDRELGTSRIEKNPVLILSGINYNQITLGTPISLMIPNLNYNSDVYQDMEKPIRPGHGDFSYRAKYGIAETKGGGRASGRECIARLAAGAIAFQLIQNCYPSFFITSRVTAMAGCKIEDKKSYLYAKEVALNVAKEGDSTGGEVTLKLSNIPAGCGRPVFRKLEARLAEAILSIGAVKSFEIGSGKECANMKGSEHNDSFYLKSEKNRKSFSTSSNHAGGTLAGISSGKDIEIIMGVKPTPTIYKEQQTIDRDGTSQVVQYKGRYDKNITPRIGPIAEAMVAMVFADELIASGFIDPANITRSNSIYAQDYEHYTYKSKNILRRDIEL